MKSVGLTELATRSQLIDTQLAQAGWSSSRLGRLQEVLLRAEASDSPDAGNLFADYVLMGFDGKPLAGYMLRRGTCRADVSKLRNPAFAYHYE